MNEQKRSRTQRDIILALAEILQTTTFEQITVQAICEVALVTRSTFYRYFADKYAAAEALIEYLGTRDLMDPVDGLVLDRVQRFVERNEAIIRHLNPSNQQRANFHVEFLRMVERAMTLFYETNQQVDRDPIIQMLKQATQPALMIKFIAGGVTSIIIDSQHHDKTQQTQAINFIVEIINQLADRGESNHDDWWINASVNWYLSSSTRTAI